MAFRESLQDEQQQQRQLFEVLTTIQQDENEVAKELAVETFENILQESEISPEKRLLDVYQQVLSDHGREITTSPLMPYSITIEMVASILMGARYDARLTIRELVELFAVPEGISTLRRKQIQGRTQFSAQDVALVLQTMTKIAQGNYLLPPRVSTAVMEASQSSGLTTLLTPTNVASPIDQNRDWLQHVQNYYALNGPDSVPFAPRESTIALSTSALSEHLMDELLMDQAAPTKQYGGSAASDVMVISKPQFVKRPCSICKEKTACKCIENNNRPEKPVSIQLAFNLAVASYNPEWLNTGDRMLLMADLVNPALEGILDGYLIHPQAKPFFDDIYETDLDENDDSKAALGPIYDSMLDDQFYLDRIDYLRMQLTELATADLTQVRVCNHRQFLFNQPCNFRTVFRYYQQAYKQTAMHFPAFINHETLSMFEYNFWMFFVGQLHHIHRNINTHALRAHLLSRTYTSAIEVSKDLIAKITRAQQRPDGDIPHVEIPFTDGTLSLWCKLKIISQLSNIAVLMRQHPDDAAQEWIKQGGTLLQLVATTVAVPHILLHDFLAESLAKDPIIETLEINKYLSGGSRRVSEVLASDLHSLQWLGYALANPPRLVLPQQMVVDVDLPVAEITIFIERAASHPGGIKAAFLEIIGDFHHHGTAPDWLQIMIWLKGVSSIVELGEPSFPLAASSSEFYHLKRDRPDERLLQLWVAYGQDIVRGFMLYSIQQGITHMDFHTFDLYLTTHATNANFSLVDCRRVLDLFDSFAFEPGAIEGGDIMKNAIIRAAGNVGHLAMAVYSIQFRRLGPDTSLGNLYDMVGTTLFTLAMIHHEKLHQKQDSPSAHTWSAAEDKVQANVLQAVEMLFALVGNQTTSTLSSPESIIKFDPHSFHAASIENMITIPDSSLYCPKVQSRSRRRGKRPYKFVQPDVGAMEEEQPEENQQIYFQLFWECGQSLQYETSQWSSKMLLIYGAMGRAYYQENRNTDFPDEWQLHFRNTGTIMDNDVIQFVPPTAAYEALDGPATARLVKIAMDYTFIREQLLPVMSVEQELEQDEYAAIRFTSLIDPSFTTNLRNLVQDQNIIEQDIENLISANKPIVRLLRPLVYHQVE